MQAVLFDWRGTLVVPPTIEHWVTDGLRRLGRSAAPNEIAVMTERIIASSGQEDRLDAAGLDTDSRLHRTAFMGVFADAGIEGPLAEAMYASESDYGQNPFASDAAPTILALRHAGILVGIVSDIHFDVRPAFAAVGLADAVNSYSLSFEIGAQKPDPAMFAHALTSLGIPAHEAIMVGDRSRPDGGAVECGIPTLLLPPLRSPADERLRLVRRLAL